MTFKYIKICWKDGGNILFSVFKMIRARILYLQFLEEGSTMCMKK